MAVTMQQGLGMVGRRGAHWCFLKGKGGAACSLGGARQACLVDCNPTVRPVAESTANPTDHPNGNASRHPLSHRLHPARWPLAALPVSGPAIASAIGGLSYTH